MWATACPQVFSFVLAGITALFRTNTLVDWCFGYVYRNHKQILINSAFVTTFTHFANLQTYDLNLHDRTGQARPGELPDHPAGGVCPQVFPYLGPRMSFNLRELKFCVVWVHLTNLFPCWGSQHLKIDGGGVWVVFYRCVTTGIILAVFNDTSLKI